MHGHWKHLEWETHYPTYALRIGGYLEWNRAYQTFEIHVHLGCWYGHLLLDYRAHEWDMDDYMMAADTLEAYQETRP